MLLKPSLTKTLHHQGVISPVEDDPFIDVAGESKPLRLAMNTNQYGRTFQDRTHAYVVSMIEYEIIGEGSQILTNARSEKAPFSRF